MPYTGLFISGPLDGQIKRINPVYHRVHASTDHPVSLTFDHPPSYEPIKVTEYLAHEFVAGGESFFIMGPSNMSARDVFATMYSGYSAAVTKRDQLERDVELLKAKTKVSETVIEMLTAKIEILKSRFFRALRWNRN